MARHILQAMRRFVGSTDGGLSVETVLVFPMLAWIYAAGFVFFDAFRADTSSVKGSFTISDILSRQTTPLDQADVDGLRGIFNYVTGRPADDTAMVLTAVSWDLEDNDYRVIWSRSSGTDFTHTDDTLRAEADRLPLISIGDTLIVVETEVTYRPLLNVGLGIMTLREFVPSRPRFASWVMFEGVDFTPNEEFELVIVDDLPSELGGDDDPSGVDDGDGDDDDD